LLFELEMVAFTGDRRRRVWWKGWWKGLMCGSRNQAC